MKTILLSLFILYISPAGLLAQSGPALRAKQSDSAQQQAFFENEKQGYRTLIGQTATDTYGFSVASNNFHVYFYRCEWQADPTIRTINGKVTSWFTISTATLLVTLPSELVTTTV